MLVKRIYSSPIGDLSLVANERGLIGAWFVGQKHFERGLTEESKPGSSHLLNQASAWLDNYFAGEQPVFDLPVAVRGTAFQEKVWAELAQIPYGQTVTYKQLADKLNCKSAQAIGGAVGKNPLSIFIPCHRVLGSDGQLTGYAGGLDRKEWLLKHEKLD